MLKSAFGAVKCIRSSLTESSICVPANISNLRKIVTARTLNKNTDQVPDMRDMVKPSTLEKYILVIATVYRKPSDVPDRVSFQQLKRAYDLARGRTMVAMVFFWSVVLYFAMVSGRRLRDSGYSLELEGQKREAELQAKGRLERKKAAE